MKTKIFDLILAIIMIAFVFVFYFSVKYLIADIKTEDSITFDQVEQIFLLVVGLICILGYFFFIFPKFIRDIKKGINFRNLWESLPFVFIAIICIIGVLNIKKSLEYPQIIFVIFLTFLGIFCLFLAIKMIIDFFNENYFKKE